MDLLTQLNEGQRTAVEYNDGPSLVIAGAGSGKTRVLTYKIAYLISQGMKPWNILALTFTNKAAGEMKDRIGRLVGEENARYINMGTFHSVFSRILRQEAELLGYTSQFTIYDEADSRSLIKAIVKEKQLDDKVYKPAAVHNKISMAKNHIIDANGYASNAEIFERDRQDRMPSIGDIYVSYEARCRKSNAMDFDDLLMLTYKLFRDNDDIRHKWAQRYQFILVDEYQDTNRVQQQIVEQLSRENQRVCVVGDDAQSIYAFRGANIDNILDFNRVYPGSKLFKLEQNYRSTQRIVQAANSLIKHNERQIPKNVFSENDEGDALVFKEAASDREEAAIVCNEVKRLKREENCGYSDFAILYRTNAQSRTFEDECLKQGIPYKIYGGLSFYQRKEIKDVIAYFRLVANRYDEEAFKRIINYPARGIGDTTVSKIIAAAQAFDVSLWDVASDPVRYQLKFNSGTIGKLNLFTSKIIEFVDMMPTADAYTIGQHIIQESGIYKDLYSSQEPEYITRQENLEEFLAAIQDFVEECREEGRFEEATLTAFLQDVALQTDKESDDGNESKLTMMTVHAAKGLEFPTVFVVGLEENIFPSAMAATSVREIEEERRLLYVAITRAEKHCFLTCAKNRWRFGNLESEVPSRFLRDIDQRLLKVDSCTFGSSQRSGYGSSQRGGYGDRPINTPYKGSVEWGNDYPEYSSRMQNSRPVAGQFRADVKPKITRPHHETPVDPLSPMFRRQMEQAKYNHGLSHGARAGGFRQATDAGTVEPVIPKGLKRVVQTSSGSAGSAPSVAPGNVVEHQRFGVGTVLKVEGTGDNAKATVEFRNTGTKQLLLKFAKLTIVK